MTALIIIGLYSVAFPNSTEAFEHNYYNLKVRGVCHVAKEICCIAGNFNFNLLIFQNPNTEDSDMYYCTGKNKFDEETVHGELVVRRKLYFLRYYKKISM